ncbi:MAG TPA: SURF1 family protein, partial [Microlunatus sp.]
MSQQATRPEQPRSRTASGSSGRRPSGQRPSGQGPGGRGKRPTAPKPEPKHPLWVRWLALVLFVAVLGVAFVNLGEWQLRRLHERRVDNVVIRTNEAAPVADFDQLFSQPITEQQEWRRVRVTGTFDAGQQYVIRYRDNGDDSGYEVVTPLRTSSGKTVLIDRGFIAIGGGQQIPSQAPAPPSGTVTIVGRARASETGRDSATVPVNGSARLINTDKIGADLKEPIAAGYIDVLTMQPKDTEDFDQIVLPELSDGPHFWYAVQWFMFTGIGVLGIVV